MRYDFNFYCWLLNPPKTFTNHFFNYSNDLHAYWGLVKFCDNDVYRRSEFYMRHTSPSTVISDIHIDLLALYADKLF